MIKLMQWVSVKHLLIIFIQSIIHLLPSPIYMTVRCPQVNKMDDVSAPQK